MITWGWIPNCLIPFRMAFFSNKGYSTRIRQFSLFFMYVRPWSFWWYDFPSIFCKTFIEPFMMTWSNSLSLTCTTFLVFRAHLIIINYFSSFFMCVSPWNFLVIWRPVNFSETFIKSSVSDLGRNSISLNLIHTIFFFHI